MSNFLKAVVLIGLSAPFLVLTAGMALSIAGRSELGGAMLDLFPWTGLGVLVSLVGLFVLLGRSALPDHEKKRSALRLLTNFPSGASVLNQLDRETDSDPAEPDQ